MSRRNEFNDTSRDDFTLVCVIEFLFINTNSLRLAEQLRGTHNVSNDKIVVALVLLAHRYNYSNIVVGV